MPRKLGLEQLAARSGDPLSNSKGRYIDRSDILLPVPEGFFLMLCQPRLTNRMRSEMMCEYINDERLG